MKPWMLSTVTLGGTLRDKFEALAAAGFNEIELFHDDLADEPSPAAVARMADDLGLRIATLLPLRDFSVTRDAGQFLDVASILGARLVVACSSTSPTTPASSESVCAALAALADRAAGQNLHIGFEALPWATHIRRLDQAITIVRLADRANLGLVLDSFHVSWEQDGLAGLGRLLEHEIALVQISDAHPDPRQSVLEQSRNARYLPGEGSLPLRAFHEAVRLTGYHGPFSLEIFNPILRQRPPGELAHLAMQSIARTFAD